MSRTVWIRASQLGRDNSALGELLHPGAPLPPSRVLMIEPQNEGTGVRYHRRTLVLQFSAMRHFAEELRKRKITVDYYPLRRDGSHPHRTYEDALRLHIQTFSPDEITIMELPDLDERLATTVLLTNSGTPFRVLRNTAMLTDPDHFPDADREGGRGVMERRYRSLRTRCRLLVDDGRPTGGRWKATAPTRALPVRGSIPRPLSFLPDSMTTDVMQTVDALFPGHPGATTGFDLPVTHSQAIALADDFIAHRLPHFAEYGDVMLSGEPLLYHSFLSPFLNIGLLSPLHLLKKIEHAYHTGVAPLHAAESFIRNVLGRREYLYGMYRALMPACRTWNYLNARRRLPPFFWNGETDLTCLADSITLALRTGYLHHTQRLMIIGNFATLTQIRPPELLAWHMSLFLDAREWIALPAVFGMGTFADGGRIASRPSAFTGVSIRKRSDYCSHCRYSVRTATGPDACPFNYLYWNFLGRHRSKLSGLGQFAQHYRTLDNLTAAERRNIRTSAEKFLTCLSH